MTAKRRRKKSLRRYICLDMTKEQAMQIDNLVDGLDKYALIAQPRLRSRDIQIVVLSPKNWQKLNTYFNKTKMLQNKF